MRKPIYAFLCGTIICFCTTPSMGKEQLYEATYKGVVDQGDFMNDAVSLSFVFSFDPYSLQPNVYNELGGDAYNSDQPQYGTQFAYDNPIENAYFSVGGKHYSILGTDINSLDRSYYDTVNEGDEIDNGVQESFGADGARVATASVSSTNGMFDSGDPRSPFSYTVQPGDTSYGNLWGYGAGARYSSSFTVTSVSERLLGALPEPASWITMIMGFGLIGWILRRDNARTRILQPA